MIFDERLAKVPDFKEFFAVKELLRHAEEVAATHPNICKIENLGYSKNNTAIPMVSIGNGPVSVLLFAFPHPNEPVGAMLSYFLIDELTKDTELRNGRTWHIIPCIDPDGASLNEGWFKGPFSIRDYARHYFRTKGEDQVEWSFPIEYKTLKFDRKVPETIALMKAITETRPAVMYSLHNSGFGGVYYYISKPLEGAYETFYRLPRERQIPLSLGEPEMPFSKVYSPAVFDMPCVTDAYDYYEKYGDGDPAKHISGGASSRDFADAVCKPITLVTEVPYFISPKIADLTKTDKTRKQAILTGLGKLRRMLTTVQAIIDETIGELTEGTIFSETTVHFVKQMTANVEDTEIWANEDPKLEVQATVAQKMDAEYISVFRNMTIFSMYRRALRLQIEKGASKKIVDAYAKLDNAIECWINEVEQVLEYEVVPIKHLVEIQYGALLAVLDALG